RRGRSFELEGDGPYFSTPAQHFFCPHNFLDAPVAAFDQYVRAALMNEGERRVFLEPGDESYAFQSGGYREPVFEGIDRPIRAFAQAFDGGIRVQCHDEARAQRARLGEVCDMTPMQDVEDPVGENERPVQRAQAFVQFLGRDDLGFKGETRTHDLTAMIHGGSISAAVDWRRGAA